MGRRERDYTKLLKHGHFARVTSDTEEIFYTVSEQLAPAANPVYEEDIQKTERTDKRFRAENIRTTSLGDQPKDVQKSLRADIEERCSVSQSNSESFRKLHLLGFVLSSS